MAQSQDTEAEPSTAPDSKISTTASIHYWNTISSDVNGMLGGYPQISRVDLRGSLNFTTKIRRLSSNCQVRNAPKLTRGVDCGAGIGRVTEGFLSNVCDVVDVVEPVSKFAKVLEDGPLKQEGKVGDVYVTGLQDWMPTKTYDLVWNQWCLGHLTDSQLVLYFKRCGAALSEGGWIVVKENLSTHRFGDDIYDDVDSSVTRSDQKFRDLFKEAGMHIAKAELQIGFPKGLGLYPVKMYALRPK
jgi:protein N-terminal methyltransferase